MPTNYGGLLGELKARIQSARVKAALAANAELISLYWDMGKMIVKRQEEEGWGKSVIEQLSKDLQAVFPDQKGLSPRNIWRMRQLYLEWFQKFIILPQPVAELENLIHSNDQLLNNTNLSQLVTEIKSSPNIAQPNREIELEGLVLQIIRQLPWGQNIVLLLKLKDPRQRLWYALKTIENGWSRNVLTAQIESNLIERQGNAFTNFDLTLPKPDSDLAQNILKDSYLLNFISADETIKERELEDQLSTHMTQFLMELGKGFAFVGRQYRLEVGGDEFYVDLLFYHLHLHCYIVIELKTGKFEPEYAGKMNFYLEAIDRQVRTPQDNPSIGLILCKEQNHIVVEYALARIGKPMGVSAWRLTNHLPDDYHDQLPTVKQLTEELRKHQMSDDEKVDEI